MNPEPWKRKEPGARLSKKAARDKALGTMERAAMEEQSKKKIHIQIISMALFSRNIQKAKSFIVYLDEPLTVEEIKERVEQAFGDI